MINTVHATVGSNASDQKEQPEKFLYETTHKREILGVMRQKGERLRLSERAAQYYLPPQGFGLQRVPDFDADADPAESPEETDPDAE